MSRFYLMSETVSPVFAWGFLGTDTELNDRCMRFKVMNLCMNERLMGRQMNEDMESGQMDRQMSGEMNGQMNGQMNK